MSYKDFQNFASLAGQFQYAESMRVMFEDIYKTSGLSEQSIIKLTSKTIIENQSIRKCSMLLFDQLKCEHIVEHHRTKLRMKFKINEMADLETFKINRKSDKFLVTGKMSRNACQRHEDFIPEHSWTQGNILYADDHSIIILLEIVLPKWVDTKRVKAIVKRSSRDLSLTYEIK